MDIPTAPTSVPPAAPPLKVLLVDDEALARLRLAALVADCPSPRAEVAGEAANATQALVWLAGHACDAVLADIAMPGRDGLDLAAEVAKLPSPPAVVFVTAHAGHALAAFDLAAVDYLTKPVRRERLHAALQRIAARRPGSVGATAAPATGAAPAAVAAAPADDGEPVVLVRTTQRLLRIPAADVLYLKAEWKYVTLRTADATHVLDDPLSVLEKRLGARFVRVHRSLLVARRAMRALERRAGSAGADDAGEEEGWAVQVQPTGEWLTVSRRRLAAVREAMAAEDVR